MTSLKKILENSLFYTFTTILLRASTIIFFPIFSFYLTSDDYGILNITQGLVQIVSAIGGLGLLSALTRFIYTHYENKHESGLDVVSTVMSVMLPVNIFICAVVFLLNNWLSKLFLNEIPFFPFMSVYLLSIPFNTVVDVYRYYLVSIHDGKKTMILNLLFFVSQVMINVTMVSFFEMHVMGIIYGILINAIVFSIYSWVVFYRNISWKVNGQLARRILSFSLPLLPFALLNILIENVDKFMLNNRSGTYTSGLYYITITFSSIFSTVKESVILAITPWMYETMKAKPNFVRTALVSIFMGVSIAAIGISWFSREVLMLLSSKPIFVQAYIYIPLGVLGYYIIHLGQLFSIKTFYLGNFSKYLWLSTAVGVAVNYITGFFLIPRYLIYGALFAKLMSYIALVVVAICLSRLDKQLSDIYDLKRLMLLLVGTSLFLLFPLLQVDFYLMLLLKILIFFLLVTGFLIYIEKRYNILNYVLKKVTKN